MLKKTFCHISGITVKTEKMLWDKGILDWDDFLENIDSINELTLNKRDLIKRELYFSKIHLEQNNLDYFKEQLPQKELWRCSKYGKIAYVDIETTGLSRWTDKITTIGIYDGETSKIYIRGIDLEQAKEALKKYDILVTFNGKSFDMPFIEQHFKEKYNHLHLDLRFLLKEFGHVGGLKKIETELGITRPNELEGVDGFEAVRLWRRYERGDVKALEKLIQYNKEDIVNLKTLLNIYLDRKKELLGLELPQIIVN